MQQRESKAQNEFCQDNRKGRSIRLGMTVQLPDLGIWLAFGLPGMVYACGAGRAWLAIGFFLGTVINWQVMPYRLMRYTAKSKDVVTVPEYLSARFHESNNILKYSSAALMAVLLFLYIIVLLKWSGAVLSRMLGLPVRVVIAVCLLAAVIYTCAGGIRGLFSGDFIHGMLLFFSLLLVPICIFIFMSPGDIVRNIMNSGPNGGASVYLNVLYRDGAMISPVEIISQLSVGIVWMGMPQLLTKFLSAQSGKEINRGRRTAIVFTLIALVSACVLGGLGRAVLYSPAGSSTLTNPELVFFEMVKKLFQEERALFALAGLLFYVMLLTVISTLCSQLYTVAVSLYRDIIKDGFLRKAAPEKSTWGYRGTLVFLALLAYLTAIYTPAWNQEWFYLMWIALGCTFGPVVLVSLYWKRMNLCGAMAGMLGGCGSVFLWQYAKLIPEAGCWYSLAKLTGMNAVLPGFLISVLLIFLVSLATKDVSEEVKKEFEEVKYRII
jgi:sodium/proline symporter